MKFSLKYLHIKIRLDISYSICQASTFLSSYDISVYYYISFAIDYICELIALNCSEFRKIVLFQNNQCFFNKPVTILNSLNPELSTSEVSSKI